MEKPTVEGFSDSPPEMLVTVLHIMAMLLLLTAVIAGGGIFVWAVTTGRGNASTWLLGSGCLMAGFFAAAVLWALSWMIRRQYEMCLFQRRKFLYPNQEFAGGRELSVPPVLSSAQSLQPVLAELVEIKSNLLLSPQQLEIKRRQWQLQQSQQLAQQIRQSIQDEYFDRAVKLLDELSAQVPDHPELPVLRGRLEDSRSASRETELKARIQRAKDLMAGANFTQAREEAQQLLAKYPQAPEALALHDHVCREAELFLTEQRRRLYAEIEKYADARQWRPALASAQKFLEAYPQSNEAQLVQVQLQTISDNAQIEEVRELRDDILDLIERRRYKEALDLARQVVMRFPHTAAAEELRSQIERLAEKAKTEEQ